MTKVIFQQWGGFSNIITAESRYQFVVMTRNYFLQYSVPRLLLSSIPVNFLVSALTNV